MMVPKICMTSALELVTLCGKRDSEDATQLRILRRGDHPGLFRRVHCCYTGPYNRKAGGLDAEIEESGLPCWLSGKESACSAGDPGLIPGSGRFPEEGNGCILT